MRRVLGLFGGTVLAWSASIAPYGVGGMPPSTAVPAYPAWFLAPPAGTAAVLVPRFASEASRWQVARDSAVQVLGRMGTLRVRVRQRATEVDGVGLDLDPSDVREVAAAVPESVVVLDTAARPGAAFLLGAATWQRVDAGRDFVRPPARAPTWVTMTPPGLFASAGAPIYANEDGSWWEAEQRARVALAAAERVRARSATSLESGEVMALRTSDVRVDLVGVRVVARWRDASSVHVLVQADQRRGVP